MKLHFYNSLIALFGGLFASSTLFIIICFIDIYFGGELKNPFSATFLGNFLYYLIFAGVLEEGTKFLLIKRDVGQYPYGFLLGFSFGTGETFFTHPFSEFGIAIPSRSGVILLHTFTAGIIAYFVAKNKPLLGLAVAIVIHAFFNTLV